MEEVEARRPKSKMKKQWPWFRRDGHQYGWSEGLSGGGDVHAQIQSMVRTWENQRTNGKVRTLAYMSKAEIVALEQRYGMKVEVRCSTNKEKK